MSGFGVSDHALLRFLDRGASSAVEQLRAALMESLARAHAAARSITDSDYLIRADGVLFVVRGETVATVLEDREFCAANALQREHPRPQ